MGQEVPSLSAAAVRTGRPAQPGPGGGFLRFIAERWQAPAWQQQQAWAAIPLGKRGLPEAVLQLQGTLRLKHYYSQRTEETYVHWLRQYWGFLQGHKPTEGFAQLPGEAKVKQFLEHLAVERHVAAATQNQAFNAG
ncbi:MAG: phage integrase N-terminal SAM-like domain-containing protein [Chloroflexi bacterium]|nr:phage integrase N-terminal SAM-like domain-containing protein [Chloroflexota bacterium]